MVPRQVGGDRDPGQNCYNHFENPGTLPGWGLDSSSLHFRTWVCCAGNRAQLPPKQSITSCKSVCDSDDDCYAYEFNTATKGCRTFSKQGCYKQSTSKSTTVYLKPETGCHTAYQKPGKLTTNKKVKTTWFDSTKSGYKTTMSWSQAKAFCVSSGYENLCTAAQYVSCLSGLLPDPALIVT